jgi:predicted transcriptional regulator
MTTKTPVAIRIDSELLTRLDFWIRSQAVPPSRTAVFETAIQEFLDRHSPSLDQEQPLDSSQNNTHRGI